MRRTALILLALLFSTGCGSAWYQVVDPPKQDLRSFRSVMVHGVEIQSWLSANPAVAAKCHPSLMDASTRIPLVAQRHLARYYPITSAPSEETLVVESQVMLFRPGSRALRYFIGFGAGKGVIGVRCTLVDGGSNEVIGVADVYGSVRGGAWGGPLTTAFNYCGAGIARLILEQGTRGY